MAGAKSVFPITGVVASFSCAGITVAVVMVVVRWVLPDKQRVPFYSSSEAVGTRQDAVGSFI